MLSTDHYQVLVVQQQQQQQQQHKAVNDNSMPTDPNTLVASSVTLEMLQVQLLDDSKFPWHWLPVELARRIFAHLSFEELATASLVGLLYAL